MFKRKKIPSVRESLLYIANELRRGHDVQREILAEMKAHTEILREKGSSNPALESSLQAARDMNETWRPLIDRLMNGADAATARGKPEPAPHPSVEIKASGIRTTADPKV